MRNSFNFNPALYKALTIILCFIGVLLYNKSKATGCTNTQVTTKVPVATNKVENNDLIKLLLNIKRYD